MKAANRPPYAAGFASVATLPDLDALEVEGEIPAWIDGRLLKTGPGAFELGTTALTHQFDGPALLQCYEIAAGRVRWRARWLQSPLLREARAAGRLTQPTFATAIPLAERARIEAEVKAGAPPSVNGSVAFVEIDGALHAVTDGSQFATAIDPRTLETRAILRFADALSGATADGRPASELRRATTAHYVADPADGSLINYFVQFGAAPSYNFFCIRRGERRRRPIGLLPTSMPSFVHSFGLTERFIVFPEFPLVCDARKLAEGAAYGRSLHWRDDLPARIHVLGRDDAVPLCSFDVDPFYVMHAVNAYEEGAEIVWDVLAYDDGAHVSELYLEPSARPPGGAYPEARAAELRSHATLRRLRIPLAGGRVRCEPLSSLAAEFPVLADPARLGRRYGTLFSSGLAGREPEDRYYNQLLRFDPDRGRERVWRSSGTYVGEPIFVPAPGSKEEGDGALLVCGLDSAAGQACLLALDARSMQLLGRARLPFGLPFAFHGAFLPRSALS